MVATPFMPLMYLLLIKPSELAFIERLIIPAMRELKDIQPSHYCSTVIYEDKSVSGQVSIPSIGWSYCPNETPEEAIERLALTQRHGKFELSNGDRVITYPGIDQKTRHNNVRAQFLFDGVTDPQNRDADTKMSLIISDALNELLYINPDAEREFCQISSPSELETWIVETLHPALVQRCNEMDVIGRATGAIAFQNVESGKVFISVWGDSQATVFRRDQDTKAVTVTQIAVPNQEKWNRPTLLLGNKDQERLEYILATYGVKFNGPNSGDPGVIGYRNFSRTHIVSTEIDMNDDTFVALSTDGVNEMAETLRIKPYYLLELLIADSFAKIEKRKDFYFSIVDFLKKLSLYCAYRMNGLNEKRKKVDDLSIAYIGNYFPLPYIYSQEVTEQTVRDNLLNQDNTPSLILERLREHISELFHYLVPEVRKIQTNSTDDNVFITTTFPYNLQR